MDKRAGQVGEAVVCRGAGQPRQQSRYLQASARGRPGRLRGRDCRCRIGLQDRLDILPRLKAMDSWMQTYGTPAFLQPELPILSNSEMPFRSILRAARTSRSLIAPHDGHTHVRSRNDSPLYPSLNPKRMNVAVNTCRSFEPIIFNSFLMFFHSFVSLIKLTTFFRYPSVISMKLTQSNLLNL